MFCRVLVAGHFSFFLFSLSSSLLLFLQFANAESLRNDILDVDLGISIITRFVLLYLMSMQILATLLFSNTVFLLLLFVWLLIQKCDLSEFLSLSILSLLCSLFLSPLFLSSWFSVLALPDEAVQFSILQILVALAAVSEKQVLSGFIMVHGSVLVSRCMVHNTVEKDGRDDRLCHDRLCSFLLEDQYDVVDHGEEKVKGEEDEEKHTSSSRLLLHFFFLVIISDFSFVSRLPPSQSVGFAPLCARLLLLCSTQLEAKIAVREEGALLSLVDLAVSESKDISDEV